MVDTGLGTKVVGLHDCGRGTVAYRHILTSLPDRSLSDIKLYKETKKFEDRDDRLNCGGVRESRVEWTDYPRVPLSV